MGLNKLKRNAGTAWLEKTNPLAGMSIREAQAIFDAARAGDTQRLHWMFQEIESANPVLMTCVERRVSALSGFRPSVTARPAADPTLADEQRDAITRFLDGIENFTDALEHLDLAFFRGFSYVQPIWEADGTVRHIELPESWIFLTKDGELYFNPVCDGMSRNAELVTPAAKLIGVRRRRPIDYPALSIHIRQAVGNRDWGRFLERIALPKPAVIMAPTASEDEKDKYIEAAERVEDGQVSVWPNGSSLTDFMGGSRGQDPFSSFIRHQEEKIVLLSTGGTLTSLAQADTGSLAGGAQMDVWREIVRKDASVVAQALNGMVREFLDRAFPGQPVAAEFTFDTGTKLTAQEAATVAATLKGAGWLVKQDELEKAVGFTLEKAPETPVQTPFSGLPLVNKAETPLQTALQGVAKREEGSGRTTTPESGDAPQRAILDAFAKDTSKAAEAVKALLADPTPEKAEQLLADLPSLIPEDPALAAVIAEAMVAEFASTTSHPSHKFQNAPLENKDGEKCQDCGQWLDGNGVCHECRGRDDLASEGYNPDDEKMKSAEIGKGKAAVKKCLNEGVDCYDAISRSDIGSISLIYGQPVDDDSGKAFGLSHLFHKHQGEGIVENLAESIIRGKVREPGKVGNKIAIDYKGYEIHLAKSFSRKGNPNTDKVTWVITGFKTDKEDA